MPVIAVAAALTAAAALGAVYVNFGGDGNVAVSEKTPSGKLPGYRSKGLGAYSVGEMITFVAAAEPKDLPEIEFID
ncbi:MAG TPA: hypothetical protein ENH05_08695, partial [Rhizobiales bacterium]|nr:hypothetical protein [Hyphomicrobiales bacterium]